MIRLEEGGANNTAIDKNVEQLKQVTSQENQNEVEIQKSLGIGRKDLMQKLKEGIMNNIERKMHQHVIQEEEFDRKTKIEAKGLDDDVNKAKIEAKNQIKEALNKRDELTKKINSENDDETLKQRLLQQLGSVENQLLKSMNAESED